ncbi:polysaccharide pyruvyl transferase family protein [Halodesulfurarchaeum formicicum]|uniref:Polysaccharide pyruvyl transferase domain-containing protein n=1 Tax=Halodesulfurarchaeum formicicum TaxID=1873524 RepID=A0A1J1AC21_9EURY|nr:polysaccharide pyruvyl transferase family protein [Halodesulfurarchaeum formicicum]APE95331.1 hypothetical protein HSR6_0878 [Halodesulfurarchaeum formicicum]
MDDILFISDTSDGQNWGCYETSRQLRNLLLESVDIQYTVFLNEIRDPIRTTVPPSLSDVQYLIGESSKIFESSSPIYRRFLDHGLRPAKHVFDIYPRVMDQFENKSELFLKSKLFGKYFPDPGNIDQVVINGEGSIHGNRIKSRILLFFAYIWRVKLDKPTHIVNHTLQIDTPELKEMIKVIYPQLNSIAFREPISKLEYHSKIGDTNNTIQAADTAWLLDDCLTKTDLNTILRQGGMSVWHPTEIQPSFDFTDRYVCVSGGSGFGHGKEDSEKIAEIIRSLLDNNIDANILLVAPAQHDEHILLRVAEGFNLPLAKVSNNSLVGASIIGNSELYLGGRWHGSIFALLNGARLVNFKANTFKMRGLKDMTNHPYQIYPSQQAGNKADEIAKSVISGLDKSIGDGQEKMIKSLQSMSRKNLDGVREDV